MHIDKTHLGWGLASAAVFGLATAGYVIAGANGSEASGGSVAGLTFGALSLIAMTFAGLLAVRKKFPAVRLGSAQFWLRGHIWLGLLSVPLALYHSNFRFGGALEQVFMIVFFVVIASGVFGLAMQQVLPRFLKVRVPLETFPQQIPFLCQKFREEGDQLIKELQGSVKKSAPPSVAAEAGGVSAPSAAKAALAAKAVAAKASVAVVQPAPETDEAAATPAKPKSAALAAILAAKAAKAATETAVVDATSETSEAPPPAKPKSAALAALLAAKAAAKAPPDNTGAAATPTVETPNPAACAAGYPLSVMAGGGGGSTPAKAIVEKPAAAVKPTPAKADAAMPRLELLTRFYQERVVPFLSSDPLIAWRQELASENYARMAFANLAVDLPSQALAVIHRLEEMVAERRQFLVQVRIQNWLRSWLLIHVPLSAALFVLAALHVITALRVVPWF